MAVIVKAGRAVGSKVQNIGPFLGRSAFAVVLLAGLSVSEARDGPEVFRAIVADLEICKQIVLNDDWSGAENRTEVIIDPGIGNGIYTRTRGLLAKNGITMLLLGEVIVPDSRPVLAYCGSTTQRDDHFFIQADLVAEYRQWIDTLAKTPGVVTHLCRTRCLMRWTP